MYRAGSSPISSVLEREYRDIVTLPAAFSLAVFVKEEAKTMWPGQGGMPGFG